MNRLESLKVQVSDQREVSAIFAAPPKPISCYVMAHGAGAGMAHSFMTAISDGLVERGISALRCQFPFMEKGSKRPDRPSIAHATVRAAVAEAARRCPSLPLIAGGKSFGGRMTSQAQAVMPMPHVAALAFLGFPLHPAGKPSVDRALHLSDIEVPMLFLQGTRDALADHRLLEQVIARLGPSATLVLSKGADHSFHVPTKSGRTGMEVLEEILDAFADWAGRL